MTGLQKVHGKVELKCLFWCKKYVRAMHDVFFKIQLFSELFEDSLYNTTIHFTLYCYGNKTIKEP